MFYLSKIGPVIHTIIDHTLLKTDKLYLKKKQTLWPLFIDGVQLPQGYRATSGGSLVFTTKFPEIPGIPDCYVHFLVHETIAFIKISS